MGRSTKVIIGGREFSSKKAAVDHFMTRRDEVRASGPVTEGEFFDELSDLYIRYCGASPGWELNGRHIVAFVVDYELRQNGQYAQHLCFKVRFSNQELRPFSVDKAVTAIIKAEAGHATTNEAGEHNGLNG
ncbi:TPA: hypothetical protein RXP51_003417 [Escherichia coli]|uniref:hypothetical protein n=1 Tax=Escherichia coli TaxID=562 RepID=UPI0005C7506D|nr:hypothetical protein [Escherichia coli]EEQ2314295.1 hypothetical protein [Escherichia coli]EEQ8884900.1 hypothetical protein [Escherichia coli]EES0592867.1 hypothetical protein [Escherichia coli]EET7615460.1 hypothetical protein [Escherichia coli]EEV0523813.1 hypothetical protein [Escherichia coli]